MQKLFYKKQSQTHGSGIFAGRAMLQGEKILEMTGEIFSQEEVNDDMFVLQIDENTYLGTAEKGEHLDLENFINHSCAPNLGFIKGDLALYALRDIQKDEELTWDYSTSIDEKGFDVPCYCLSPDCRKRIQSFHALNKAWQEKIFPIALRYLREKYGKGLHENDQ